MIDIFICYCNNAGATNRDKYKCNSYPHGMNEAMRLQPCLYWIICRETRRPDWMSSSPLIYAKTRKHKAKESVVLVVSSFNRFWSTYIYIWHIVLRMFNKEWRPPRPWHVRMFRHPVPMFFHDCVRCLAFTSLKASWHVLSRPTGP